MKKFTNYLGKKEMQEFLESNGFKVVDIYDDAGVTNHVNAVKLNNVISRYLYESVDFELELPGGVITFSTDLNSTLGSAETFYEKIKFFFTSTFKTIGNRLKVGSRLRKVLLDKYELPGYTIGKNFKGSYKSKNGKVFNEKSYTITIAGINSELLILISTDICREFKQETVMLTDLNKTPTKVLFINDIEN